MHDALVLAVHVEEAHAGFAAVFLQGIELELGIVIQDGKGAVGGGDGMVHHRESQIGSGAFAPSRGEPAEARGEGPVGIGGASMLMIEGLPGSSPTTWGSPVLLLDG